MALYPLCIQCPACGSSDITYTCEPKCCFNHICAACYTTFELYTDVLERAQHPGLETPTEVRDCLAPTVACAKCDSVEVYMTELVNGTPATLICAACHTFLRCGFTNIETR